MKPPSRTFRLFVSSTFSDFTRERDALHARVFPELRRQCAVRGCRFLAVDLRWGVPSEAHLDQQTVRICLEELRRCQEVTPRPNVLILTGDRYGWRPLPYALTVEEFAEIARKSDTNRDRALLQHWYRLDRNAVPAVHDLRGRSGNTVDESNWRPLESRLRQLIERVPSVLASTSSSTTHYLPSITEHEIARGIGGPGRDSGRVLAVFRTLARSASRGRLINAAQDAAVAGFLDLDPEGRVDRVALEHQRRLQRLLRHRVRRQRHYTAYWRRRRLSVDHVPALCRDVLADLSATIGSEIEKLEALGAAREELERHRQFGDTSGRELVGRTEELDMIRRYRVSSDSTPFLLVGASGSGKTTLMAAAMRDAEVSPSAAVVARFVGVTPDSKNELSLIKGLIREIRRCYGRRLDESFGSFAELADAFGRSLTLATARQGLVIFIDALDQIEHTGGITDLRWIPRELPEHVKLVLSAIPGSAVDTVKHRIPEGQTLELGGLPDEAARTLLDRWLRESDRSLQDAQWTAVLHSFARCPLPLYLRLASREAIQWKSYSPVPHLGRDVPGLLRTLFRRLSLGRNHGRRLVERSLAYIAAAREGLAEDELIDVLSRDRDVMREFGRLSVARPTVDRLPPVVWSRLFFDLRPYLTEAGERDAPLLDFWHRQVRQVVESDYTARATHRRLAEFFGAPDRTWRTSHMTLDARRIVELPFQYVYAHMWDAAARALTDFDFLEARCEQSSVFALEDDFRLALARWPSRRADKAAVTAFAERVIAEAHTIARHPETLFPQLYNHLRWIDVTPEPSPLPGPINARCEGQRHGRHDWLRCTQDLRPSPPEWVRSFGGHTDGVQAVAFAPDGRTIVSGSKDSTVRVWDRSTGALRRTLVGHSGDVEAVALAADGTILSGSRDRRVNMWDGATGRIVRSFVGHTNSVDCVASAMDGQWIVSGSADATIRTWDTASGRLLRTFDAHHDGVMALSVSRDGRLLASSGRDRAIKIWSLPDCRLLQTLTGHEGAVSAVAFTADAAVLVSGSHDKSVCAWDWRDAKTLWQKASDYSSGHVESVTSVAISPDGRYVVSGGLDCRVVVARLSSGKTERTLFAPNDEFGFIKAVGIMGDGCIVAGCADHKVHVWSRVGTRLLKSFGGHDRPIDAVASTADGTRLCSGSADGAVKVWDAETGRLIRTRTWLDSWVTALAVSPDGGVLFVAVESLVSGGDALIISLDIATGRTLRQFKGHSRGVNDIVVTADGERLISASWDGTIKIWQTRSGILDRTLSGHDNGVICIALSPDGTTLASGSADGTIREWDFESGGARRVTPAHPKSVDALAFARDGSRLVSAGSEESTFTIWRARDMRRLAQREGHTSRLTALAMTPDGSRLVSAAWDGTVNVWRWPDCRLERSFDEDSKGVTSIDVAADGRVVFCGGASGTVRARAIDETSPRRAMDGHARSVSAITITADASQMISSGSDGRIKVWDVQTGLELRTLRSPEEGMDLDQVFGLAVSSDGRRLISAREHRVLEWDLARGRYLRQIVSHDNTVTALALAGDWMASGALDTRVKVTHWPTGRLRQSFESHEGEVAAVTMTSDGANVAAGFAARHAIKVWSVTRGRLRWILRGHTGAVRALAVNANGMRLLSGSEDGTCRLWDLTARRRRLIRTFVGHDGAVSAVSFHHDRRRVVSAGEDGTLRAWDIESGAYRVLFAGPAPLTALVLSRDARIVGCGDDFGRVLIFEWIP